MSASEGLKSPASSFVLENVVARALAPAPVPRAIAVGASCPSSSAVPVSCAPAMSSAPASEGGAQSAEGGGGQTPSVRTPVLARAILPRTTKSPEAFRTISEVAEDLRVPQHVLRFWETKFSAIRPLKRGGGRRYYRPEDVNLLKRIHELLYTQGYTIKGAQKLLKGPGRGAACATDQPLSSDLPHANLSAPQGSEGVREPSARVGVEEVKEQAADREGAQESLAFGFESHSFDSKSQSDGAAMAFVQKEEVSGRLSPAQREGLQAILAELTTLRTLLAAARG